MGGLSRNIQKIENVFLLPTIFIDRTPTFREKNDKSKAKASMDAPEKHTAMDLGSNTFPKSPTLWGMIESLIC